MCANIYLFCYGISNTFYFEYLTFLFCSTQNLQKREINITLVLKK